jgi:serine/threonine protein kinase
MGTDVLMGLGALHARGMLHRDIKPANILVDSFVVAQISDFGLVTDELILGYGSQAGYSDHIAFEVWKGDLTSVKTDIWAFGMTLFRLLHGKTWYEDAPKPRLIVTLGNFADTLKWLPHIPATWRRVVRTMLRDNPYDRYQSALQAQNALAALALSAARSGDSVQPYRFYFPATNCSFMFAPLHPYAQMGPDRAELRTRYLQTLTEVAKYLAKSDRGIGVQVSFEDNHFLVDWCLSAEPWTFDAQMEEFASKSPFGPVRDQMSDGFHFRN